MKHHAYYMGGGQILGRRENQEDAYLLSPATGAVPSESPIALPGPVCAVLADGMGGAQDGEIASDIVSQAAMRSMKQVSGDLSQVALLANEALRGEKQNGSLRADAGSTLIAATFRDGYLSWTSVGDSLLLLYRNRQLTLLNQQHIMRLRLQEQVRRGEITQQEADNFPLPQALYSAVCGDSLDAIDAPAPFKTEHGDRFIIASDGLHTLQTEDLQEILESHATCEPIHTVKALLEAVNAKRNPSQDNTTIVIVDYFYETAPSPEKGKWHSFMHSVIGDRTSQQDRQACHSNEKALLAAVIDGAGGIQGGERAAEVARQEIDRIWEETLQAAPPCSDAQEIIRNFLIEAHEAVKKRATVPSGNGKAAIVLLYACGDEICIGNIGDCRCYLLSNRHWKQLTEDDSILAIQLKAGHITEEEAWQHPDQSRLTQLLGSDHTPRPHVSLYHVPPHNSFLLCCDGFWGQLRPAKWQQAPLFSEEQSPEEVLREWINTAYLDADGKSDNITAVLLVPNLPTRNLLIANPISVSKIPPKPSRRTLAFIASLLVCGCIAGGVYYFSDSGVEPIPMEPLPSTTELNTQLLAAADRGEEINVKRLAEQGADLNAMDSDHNTPLLLAVGRGHETIARFLLEKGAAVNAQNKCGSTPLILAVTTGNESMVRLLLEQSADVSVGDMNGTTPLHIAAQKRYTEIVKLLLAQGAAADTPDNSGATASDLASDDEIRKILNRSLVRRNIQDRLNIHTAEAILISAIIEGNTEMVKVLIEDFNTDLNITVGEDKKTPLHTAVASGHEAIVRLLLEKGVKIEVTDINGMTPLLIAAGTGHESIIRLLLEHGANLDTKNKEGKTALDLAQGNNIKSLLRKEIAKKRVQASLNENSAEEMLLRATEQGETEMVEVLLDEAGVAIEAKNSEARTPLAVAACRGHEAIVRLLLAKGANIEARDKYGYTPLLLAAQQGHGAIVRLLLDRGAHIEAKNNDEQTPISLAAQQGQTGAVRILRERGANIEAKDKNGCTPLLSALVGDDHAGTVQLLLEMGADIEAMNSYGLTPLLLAVLNGQEATVRVLLQKGANIEAKNAIGQTPLILAAQEGHEDIVRLLLEKGADIKAKDKKGNTAYRTAESPAIKKLIRSYQR